ncbi:MAG: hypothetical protein JXB00_18145 [Bacteroidales bacterium]|nr:hypothetical protein [Bacteroidales bacterium]
MKILYAIQGTGNGHLSRATEIIPLLKKKCETDILVSGTQVDLELPFEVKYRLKGLSFIFGKKGGVDIWNTYIESKAKSVRKEIKELPVENYDFVINDFEPISGWACYFKKIPCVSLSHQAAILDKNSPKPKETDLFGKFILKNYAPSSYKIGFHFARYSKNIYTPVIRREIRELKPTDNGHYTVYLPAYDDEQLIGHLKNFDNIRWQVFSKHNKQVIIKKNIEIYPVSNDSFIQSMASSTGILCGAGFETPAEAMFLGKKLMVVPMENQYEQQCNAEALKAMGIPVIKKLKEKNYDNIYDWLNSDYKIEISYPDITAQVINRIFEMHVQDILRKNKWDKDYKLTFSKNKKKDDIPQKTLLKHYP